MLQNLQNFAEFQKIQLANLVDFEKCCKTRIFLQRSVPVQPKTSEICQNFDKTFAINVPYTTLPILVGEVAGRGGRERVAAAVRRGRPGGFPRPRGGPRRFGGLVLGCIKTKFCKKICV